MTSIAIYGSSGFGREVRWLVDCKPRGLQDANVKCFIEDEPSKVGQVVDGLPVWAFDDLVARAPETLVALGIGSPKVRQKLAARIAQSPLRAVSLIHPSVMMSERVEVGDSVVICAGSILTTGIVLGAHVQINLGCTVGHDVVLDDFATLAPGVHVSGNVHIGRGAYVGTGAVIINGTPDRKIEVGEGAVIGAGACVLEDIPPNTTVGGVPAKPLHQRPAAQ